MKREISARSVPVLVLCLTIAQGRGTAIRAKTYELQPSTAGGDEEFERTANRLQPGDELVLKGGVYSQTGRRAITCRGRPDAPIVIRAADGEVAVLTRPEAPKHRYSHNGIEVVDSEHLVLKGIHFWRGSSGVRFIRGHHITLENCEISDVGNNAITLNSGDTDSFVIRGNHIHHTGLLDASLGHTEGEGMYVGCNRAQCVASNHIIEQNYIHHLRATSGGGNDGIELKYGSHGNIVRNNVIHDTTGGKRFPGIFAYGVRDPARDKPNLIEGNIMWNCGEAIYVVSDAIVRNNIVLRSDVGIASYRHAQVPKVRNVSIVNNTIVGTQGPGLHLRWAGAKGMILANNAVYSDGIAVDAHGLEGPGLVTRANFVGGTLRGVSFDDAGFRAGGKAAAAFAALSSSASGLDVEQSDLWPLPDSPLVGSGDPKYAPPEDFNGTERGSPIDVGAYQAGGKKHNPGWKIRASFKGSKGTP